MQDIKDEGLLGFDKFKLYTSKQAEEEEKIASAFRNYNQSSGSLGLQVNASEKTPSLGAADPKSPAPFERRTTLKKDGSGSQGIGFSANVNKGKQSP